MSFFGLLTGGAETVTPAPPFDASVLTVRRHVSQRTPVAWGTGAADVPETTYTATLDVLDDLRAPSFTWGDGRKVDGSCTLSAVAVIGGTEHPLTFGGAATATLTASWGGRDNGPRRHVVSDPLPESVVLRKGEQVTIRTTLGATTTGHPSHRAVSPYRPLQLTGLTYPARTSVLLVGDSIMESGSTPTPPGTFAVRALEAAGVPHTNGGIWGITFPANGPDYNLPITGYTHVLVELGFNDIKNRYGDGSGTWQANVGTYAVKTWKAYADAGLPVWQTTTTPCVTGTYDTLAGQAVHESVAHRQPWNEWLRDGAPMISGAIAATGTTDPAAVRAGQTGHPLRAVIDVAATVEEGGADAATGKWRVDQGVLVTDGTHPNTAGHELMSAPIRQWASALTA